MSDQVCRYCDYQLGDGKYLCDPTEPSVCEPCQNLAELEVEIKETKVILSGLVNEHWKLKEQANRGHDRLTGRLPPEIIAYIFKLCTPEDPMEVDLQQMSFNTIHAPFIISTVCRSWRTVARSTPLLWNTLLLCLQSSNSRTFPGPLFVQQWIDLASPLPLSICVYASVTSVHKIFAMEIIDVLNRYADRWLELQYEGNSVLLSRFSINGQSLPQLRTLHLHVMNGFRYGRCTLNLHPKRLDKLSITGIKIAATNFDWGHLRELRIGRISLSECFEVLRRAPRLTHYTVTSSNRTGRRHEDYPLPLDPIVHSNIHDLTFVQTHLYEPIFEHLLCPSLKTLIFMFTTSPVGIPLIIEFLKRSRCSLERLSLTHANLSTEDITLLCQGIPTLTHLHIDFYHSSPVPNLFSLLSEFPIVDGRKEPRYLPALQSLALEMDTLCDLTPLPYIFGPSIAHSKNIEDVRPTLECVAIYMGNVISDNLVLTIGEETLKRIMQLKGAGVNWHIKCNKKTIDLTSN